MTPELPDREAEERDQDPHSAASAAMVAASEGEWDRLEDAGLLLVSLARQRKAGSQDAIAGDGS